MDVPDMVRILEVREETPTVNTLVLEKETVADAGQFFMLWVHGFGEKPYAFSGLRHGLEITVKKVGPFSEKICSLKKGDLIGVRGPYGNGCFRLTGKNVCIIAGGLGIAPLMHLIENHRYSRRNLTIILGANTKDELLFVRRIKRTGARLIIATDDGSVGEKCMCHEVLLRVVSDGGFDQMLCCGPENMMKEVLDISIKTGIPCYFSLERYIKCGIGICGSCSLDPNGLLVCKDGPVFNTQELRNGEFGKYRRDASGSKKYI